MIPLWLGLAVDRLLLRCRRMGTRGVMDLCSSVYVDADGVYEICMQGWTLDVCVGFC